MAHAAQTHGAIALHKTKPGILKRIIRAILKADANYRQKQKLLGTPPSQLADMGISPEMVDDLFKQS